VSLRFVLDYPWYDEFAQYCVCRSRLKSSRTSGSNCKPWWAACTAPKRFHGSVELDSTRVGRDAGKIAEEVIAHLVGLSGSTVKVTLEIEAEIPAGVPNNVVRTVTENSRTLKFTSRGFEKAQVRNRGLFHAVSWAERYRMPRRRGKINMTSGGSNSWEIRGWMVDNATNRNEDQFRRATAAGLRRPRQGHKPRERLPSGGPLLETESRDR
jgi:hypothetical protein